MITCSRLEMDIRLDRVAKSLTTFFDNDVSGSYLGLSQTAKDHMERFRSFLHAYYIESHGFWPPSEFASSFAIRRSLCRSMYMEFRALYEYLVDPESTRSVQNNKSMEGGICTFQNIRAFDTRYGLETLPHPLPLLPRSTEHSVSLGFTIRKRRIEREARRAALIASLTDASNRNPDLVKSRLVRRYNQFEKQTILDDFDPINLTEGRKVRWILIYAILQILASAISAPKDVVHTEGLSYPLCCEGPKTMPWAIELKDPARAGASPGRSLEIEEDVGKGLRGRNQWLRPDVDYISSQRSVSSKSLKTTSPSADTRSTLSAIITSTTSTIRSKSPRAPPLLRFLQKREARSTDTATKSTTALAAKPKSGPFNEILVYGYGNGLNETIDDTPKNNVYPPDISCSDQRSSARITINSSSFGQTAAAPIKDDCSSSLSRPAPFALAPKFTPPSLSSIAPYPPSRPDSPTVPTLPKTPSSSEDSSRNSAISCMTSNTSASDQEQMDHSSIKSTETTTAIASVSSTIAPAPELTQPLNITTMRSSSAFSAPSPKLPELTPQSPSVSIPSTVAGAEKYSSLRSVTESGHMGMLATFLRFHSSSSSSGVNVIKEEVEVS